MDDDRALGRFRTQALARAGARDLDALAGSPAALRLEPDLLAVLRLRLGLDRRPARPRTRPEVAEALGLGGARLEEMVAALEDDVLAELGGPAGP
ncbi:MAG TPA: hypothetical protein VL422_19510 [Miltoncostaea sp.]|jgi:hypothetical protein|nr:hypothetical protein [Miltoncostaea sp.]